jgi:hypothetical protein
VNRPLGLVQGPSTGASLITSFIDSSTGYISFLVYGNGGTWLSTTFVTGKLYHVVTDKNVSTIISSNVITGTNLVGVSQEPIAKYISNTELYICVFNQTAGQTISFYGTTGPVVGTTAQTCFIAKLNPTAQTCSWVTSIGNQFNITWRTGFLQISVSPDASKILFSGQLNVSATEVTFNVGGTPTSYQFPRADVGIFHGVIAGINTSTGALIPGSLQDISASTNIASPASMDLRVFDGGWSPDSSTGYFTVGSYEVTSYIWSTWASGTTWTARATLATGATVQLTNLAFWMCRVPLSTVSTGNWVANAILQSNVITPRDFVRPGGISYSSDGSAWFAASIYKTASSAGTSNITFLGNTITTGTYTTSGVSMLGLWKFTDSNGAYTSVTLLSSTSDTSNIGGYLGCTSAQSINIGVNTAKGNGAMRFQGVSNIANVTMNGVGCKMITNPANTFLFGFDIDSNLRVSGFNALPIRLLANSSRGTSLVFGNASDLNYSLNTFWGNVAKLNIDNLR